MSTTDLLAHVRNVADWLHENTGSVGLRMLKVTEETGEAAQAYIGLVGSNPRKGITHTRDDVAGELIDVAVTALAALHDFTDDPEGAVQAYIDRRGPRLAALREQEHTICVDPRCPSGQAHYGSCPGPHLTALRKDPS